LRRTRKMSAGRSRTADAGFTLVEVLIALSILAIGLLPLLHLQVLSLRLSGRAAVLSEADLLARATMAEMLARGVPEAGSRQGSVRGDATKTQFTWHTTVNEVRLAALEEMGAGELRSVVVQVTWQDGGQPRQVELVTYVPGKESS